MNANHYFCYNTANQLVVRSSENGDSHLPIAEILTRHAYTGGRLPVVLSFPKIIANNVARLYAAFEHACQEAQYTGQYQLAYPVKVNPNAHVITSVKEAAQAFPIHFEVGTLAELMMVLGYANAEQKIICNGFKDYRFYEQANLVAKLGYRIIVVVEHPQEFLHLEALSRKESIAFQLGLRLKSLFPDKHRPKFGLSLHDVQRCRQLLNELQLNAKLVLLHSHLGSAQKIYQNIRQQLKFICKVSKYFIQDCPNLRTIDVGGGLALSFDQAQSDEELHRYANTVVQSCQQYCQKYALPAMNVISESGRAIVEHSEVLIVDAYALNEPAQDCHSVQQWLETEQPLDSYVSPEAFQESPSLILNFSLFQSLPDHWGIQQAFLATPLEQPNNPSKAVPIHKGYDISCDPDGIFTFANPIPWDLRSPIAVFGVGAYQDVLSSYHNMLGRPARLVVNPDSNSTFNLYSITADSQRDLLQRFGHNPRKIQRRLKQQILTCAQSPSCAFQALTMLEDLFSHTAYLQTDNLVPKEKHDALAS